MSKTDVKGNVREAALDILLKIEKKQAYSNLLVNDTIKKLKIPAVDFPLLTELVYGTIQHQKKIDFYLSAFSKKPLSKLEDWVVILLRISIYQQLFLDRIPDHAAINEAVEIAKKRGHKGISGMVNGILRTMQRSDMPSLEVISNDIERLALETSNPDWLIERWTEQFGLEKTRQMAEANLVHPIHAIRVNQTLVSKADVITSLRKEGLEVMESPLIEEGLRVKKGSLANTKAFKDGWISIQDEGSMLVTHVLDPKPNENILDACAAPGGKSAHLAERMEDKGSISSVDIHSHKVKLINDQKKRLQLSIIKGEVADARKLNEKYDHESFDRILVDAPCSGLGVIQRKPDLKWSKRKDDIIQLSLIQEKILQSVWPLLKKGGRLVYSTCTVDVEENIHLIERFVDHQENASFDESMKERLPTQIANTNTGTVGTLQLFPGEFGTDGFFIASVRKQT